MSSTQPPTLTRSVSEGPFAALARGISTVTTNLLATAIVLVLGFALGWQVLSWWHDQRQTPAIEQVLSTNDSSLLADGREFSTQHGALFVQRVRGGPEAAITAMRASCRRITENQLHTQTLPPASPAERRLLDQLRNQPILEESGDVTIYQPPNQELTVAAVSRAQNRIVAWAFALPADDGVWSIYHVQPTAGARP
jgi:hypothetical protein